MPQRDRLIMLMHGDDRVRVQGREARDRIGEDGGVTKERKKIPEKFQDAIWETGETWAEIEKNVDDKVLTQ